jgi:hypothetical protein
LAAIVASCINGLLRPVIGVSEELWSFQPIVNLAQIALVSFVDLHSTGSFSLFLFLQREPNVFSHHSYRFHLREDMRPDEETSPFEGLAERIEDGSANAGATQASEALRYEVVVQRHSFRAPSRAQKDIVAEGSETSWAAAPEDQEYSGGPLRLIVLMAVFLSRELFQCESRLQNSQAAHFSETIHILRPGKRE